MTRPSAGPAAREPRLDPPAARRQTARRDVAALGACAAIAFVAVAATRGAAGTDLAAQVARGAFVRAHGLAPVDLSWYGGVHPLAYSVLGPSVVALLGARLAGAFAAVAGTMLAGLLFARTGARRPRAAVLWTAAVLTADVVDGRTTFALGIVAGLGALLAASGPGRPWLAAGVAAVTTLTSPVAGLFVALIGGAVLLAGRRRVGAALVVGSMLPLLAVQVAFADGGQMPFAWKVARPVLLASAVVLVLVRRRTVRVVAAGYLVAVLITYLSTNPVGSNVERLALLAAGPVLVGYASAPAALLVPVLAVVAYWQAQQPVKDWRQADASTASQAYSAPLVRALGSLDDDHRRVEVVPLRDHWEAAWVAPHVPLARGWERQLDTVRNPVFYRGRLDAAGYLRWLRANAVGYVALPDAPLDWSATAEARLLRAGVAGLDPVWSGEHWRVWRVSGALPLVDPPARVVAVSQVTVTVASEHAAVVRLRVRWSPWLRASGGARISRAGDTVELRLPAAGRYRIGAAGSV